MQQGLKKFTFFAVGGAKLCRSTVAGVFTPATFYETGQELRFINH
ncbi:MAG: hypothetical protein ABIQ31_22300 [Ferruginibacter sp.]